MNRPTPVSIIIRCRRPGGLRAALQSAVAQTHAPLELIVVDMAGHPDSAWNDFAQSPQYVLRHVGNAQQLGYAQASNAALAMVRGDYFCFLDDAGVFDAQHVAVLLAEALRRPAALVVYGRARVFDAHNRQVNVIGRPLHRALFFHDELFCLPSALIGRRVLDLDCRFDEALASGSDHDFLEQIAVRGEFAFLPDLPPGYSGASAIDGAARDAVAQRVYFDNMRFAKWTGERLSPSLRAGVMCRRAARIAGGGDGSSARDAFTAVLAQYPGDPDALHGLARCDAHDGQFERAWRNIREALDFDPGNADYRATADRIRQQLRRHGVVVADAVAGSVGGGIQLAPRWSDSPIAAVAMTGAAPAHRNAPCSCGSGRRYKQCCGRSAGTRAAGAPAVELAPDAALVRRAGQLLTAGEAEQAAALLLQLRPPLMLDAAVAQQAGEACLSMQLLQPALALLERAVTLSDGAQTAVAACDDCCHRMFRSAAWRSAGVTLRALLARVNTRGTDAVRAPRQIHLVCKLDTLGGTETRALNLYHCLAPHARVTLWSTVPPLPVHAAAVPVRRITATDVPAGGVLVLVGTYFACEPWLEQQPFERVVICHNLAEQYSSLMERLIEIEENPARPRVDLTFPSHLFGELAGVPGCVEYSAVDANAFCRRAAPRAHASGMTIGRHGRAYAPKFHPNDPALFRTLIARGHAVRILGGTPLEAAFADAVGRRPELLAVGQEPPRDFLESLDIYLYRKHPGLFETGGTGIVEAMAMELPVVVFPDQCGVAEIIRDGENGFLVDSEAQALDRIDRLAGDPTLRRRIGAAARADVVDLMRRQNANIVAYYLGAAPTARTEGKWRRRARAWFGRGNAAVTPQPD